jgi:hypothetical protein
MSSSVDISSKLSLQQYLSWKENKLEENIVIDPDTKKRYIRNPKSEKYVLEDGPTYRKIEDRWNKLVADSTFTKDECKQWLDNREINPKSNRKIKEGGLTYETIRSKCEYFDLNENKNIENKINERINDDMDVEEIPLDEAKDPISLICKGEKCMMKGCVWDGKYGINFEALPLTYVKGIQVYFPLLSNTRCCCFCFGHMVLMVGTISTTTITNMCYEKDVKNLMKTQDTVNKIETMEYKLKKEAEKEFIKQFNRDIINAKKAFKKKGVIGVGKAITQNVAQHVVIPAVTNLMSTIQSSSSTAYSYITNGFSFASRFCRG